MNYPDLVNGLFEAAGGIMVLLNCLQLYRDKQVKGVSIFATSVFTAWGFWNLYYYPHLGQWLSLAGGLVIVAGNFIWVSMALYYSGAAALFLLRLLGIPLDKLDLGPELLSLDDL